MLVCCIESGMRDAAFFIPWVKSFIFQKSDWQQNFHPTFVAGTLCNTVYYWPDHARNQEKMPAMDCCNMLLIEVIGVFVLSIRSREIHIQIPSWILGLSFTFVCTRHKVPTQSQNSARTGLALYSQTCTSGHLLRAATCLLPSYQPPHPHPTHPLHFPL